MLNNKQLSLDLIQHEINSGEVINQRKLDGYVNASQLCSSAGKRWYNYLREETSGNFIRAVVENLRMAQDALIQEQQEADGTTSVWVHPQIAVNLAQWLSGEFAAKVSAWVVDWVSTGAVKPTAATALPYHLDRYLTNNVRVPPGYFSILQETALGLTGPLHKLGFDIPKNWVPDISVGRGFCKWLRDSKGIDTDALDTYSHDYLDGRPLIDGVKLYPNELLGDYRDWFQSVWLPVHGKKYFASKDVKSLTFYDKLPVLAAPAKPKYLPSR